MPSLIETYSRSTGLKINRPWLREDFFPLPFQRYITLSTGSGQAAKNYSYYQDVVGLLLPHLQKAGIAIVLLGSKEDPQLNGVYDLRGKTSFGQSYYLLSNSMLHLGNDSWTAHAAGWLSIPLVALYGSTSSYIHGPYWKGNVRLLQSHRRGHKPTFYSQESPKTIDFIDPFEVARNVVDLLFVNVDIKQKTCFVGHAYTGTVLDYIPNMPLNPGFNPDAPCAIRMDLDHNEQNLIQVLQSGRKLNIVTRKPINLDILRAFKNSILSYNHELLEDCPLSYIQEINKIGLNRTFFSRSDSQEEVAAIRLKFFEHIPVQHIPNKTRVDFENSCKEYLNNKEFSIDKDIKLAMMSFKTNKFVLSRGKIYLSLAHEKIDSAIEGSSSIAKVIDDPLFWMDQAHMLVFS
ncbi:MAG: hypothetical protein HQK54_13515 [Oligoflexales bacterium]|nr:hypothetical protein [Oligoflexales bacterium]